MSANPKNDPDENNLETPQPKMMSVWGMEFEIAADHPEDFGTVSKPSPAHHVALIFRCHFCNLEVSAYGDDRAQAFSKAARELRHLVMNHQQRCDVCDANIMFRLLGEEGLEPGQKEDLE